MAIAAHPAPENDPNRVSMRQMFLMRCPSCDHHFPVDMSASICPRETVTKP